jgi:hypothetical protein
MSCNVKPSGDWRYPKLQGQGLQDRQVVQQYRIRHPQELLLLFEGNCREDPLEFIFEVQVLGVLF